MYKFMSKFNFIKCSSIYRRFHTHTDTSTFLSNAVGELTNSQIIYSFDTLSRVRLNLIKII